MSINEMDSKIKELRELRRMADELAAEIDSITDSIKAHMDAEGVETISGTDWRVTYKAVTSSRIDTSALKKALPDVVERFSKTTTARRRSAGCACWLHFRLPCAAFLPTTACPQSASCWRSSGQKFSAHERLHTIRRICTQSFYWTTLQCGRC